MSDIDQLAGFEATLTHHALVQPQVNKLKDAGTPPEFYGLIAFPAEAQATLWGILSDCAQASHNMSEGFNHGIKTNAKQAKPIAGIPDDAIVVRAATQFAPELYDSDGTLLDRENPAHLAIIKQKFYAGAAVRAVLSPYPWKFKNTRGVSLNLGGLMAVAGEPARRLAISGVDGAKAFAKYVQAGTGGVAGGGNPTPAGTGTASVETPAGNPFAQAALEYLAHTNPFA